MRIELSEAAVSTNSYGEERRFTANLVIDGRVAQVFGVAHIIGHDLLANHGEPDKLRHHVDNRLRNEITREIIEYQYGE
ncbi:hypothetical protein Stm18_028 [Stenotrophomonas phage Stm18]